MSDEYDFIIKTVVVGDSGVGKSCILLRYTDDIFESTYISTIGVDFKIKTIQIEDKTVKVQIWDTAGQERFRTIVSSYYRGAHCAMYVFDLTDKSSFLNIDKWIREVTTYSGNIPGIIIGNKCDIIVDSINTQEVEKFANDRKMRYIQTSAKLGNNVNEAFFSLIEETMIRKFGVGFSLADHKLINNNQSENDINIMLSKKIYHHQKNQSKFNRCCKI